MVHSNRIIASIANFFMRVSWYNNNNNNKHFGSHSRTNAKSVENCIFRLHLLFLFGFKLILASSVFLILPSITKSFINASTDPRKTLEMDAMCLLDYTIYEILWFQFRIFS